MGARTMSACLMTEGGAVDDALGGARQSERRAGQTIAPAGVGRKAWAGDERLQAEQPQDRAHVTRAEAQRRGDVVGAGEA